MVLAENPETGEIALKRVVQTFENESYELVHVFVNGEEIITTPNHPFYVDKFGWTLAKNLRAGDILVLSNGEFVVVEWIQHEILESPVKVYNFDVEDFHTYFVGEPSVLVHNDCTLGTYKELQGVKGYDSHHIIQNTAVKDMPGYDSGAAPATRLRDPSTKVGTEHYTATQYQRHNNYGGTYGDERKAAYISLRKAGKTQQEAYAAIKYADIYFIDELEWDLDTVLNIPKNRRREDMHGYQIRILVEIMYSIHELILKRDWDALAEIVQLECDIEEIIYELNDYPGEISECTRDDFFDSICLYAFDGYTIDAMAQFYVDGEESDLSMECSFTFNGKELKKAILHRVHVF